MRRYVAMIAAVGLGTGAVCQTSQVQAVLVMPPQSVSCPVGLSAQRHAVGTLALAGGGTPTADRQSLLVRLERREAPQLVTASGKLYGMALGTQAMNVSGGLSGEASESFALQPERGGSELRRAVIEPRRLAGVSWMELTEIRFTDGTAWHVSRGSRCIAEPSGMVLVGSR